MNFQTATRIYKIISNIIIKTWDLKFQYLKNIFLETYTPMYLY